MRRYVEYKIEGVILRMGRYLQENLTPQHYIIVRNLYRYVMSCLYFNNLGKLAFINQTDKGSHGYVQYYDKHFRLLRKKRLNILEIGVGGYENLNLGGGSLRMWKYYFPNSRIFGIDIITRALFRKKG